MKQYVFTLSEDICNANGRDVNGKELLEKMTLYGTVEDFDATIAREKARYQAVIDKINEQYSSIKEQALTKDEIELVNSYRQLKQKLSQSKDIEIDTLKKQLTNVKEESELRVKRIKELLD